MVRDNNEYQSILDLLYQKRQVNAVLISFDIDLLEPFRIRTAGVIDPRLPSWSGAELRFGTHVSFLIIRLP